MIPETAYSVKWKATEWMRMTMTIPRTSTLSVNDSNPECSIPAHVLCSDCSKWTSIHRPNYHRKLAVVLFAVSTVVSLFPLHRQLHSLSLFAEEVPYTFVLSAIYVPFSVSLGSISFHHRFYEQPFDSFSFDSFCCRSLSFSSDLAVISFSVSTPSPSQKCPRS